MALGGPVNESKKKTTSFSSYSILYCQKVLADSNNFQEARVTLLTPSLLKASVSVPRYCSSFQLKELLICADKICTNHSAKNWTI